MILRDISELLKTIERMEQMDDYNEGEKNIIRWVHSELISAPYMEIEPTLVNCSGKTDMTDATATADHFYGREGQEPQTVETMSCAECIHKPIGAEICEEPCHYEPKDEQTDCAWR